MSTETRSVARQLQRLKGRDVRTQSIATRFTRDEERSLLHVAASRGRNLREWAREVMLAAAQQPRPGRSQEETLFVELQALRLLLINTLEPLLRGEKMSPEQFKAMLQYVKNNKRKAAADTLAGYAEESGEKL